jgi:hypothetical protein
LSLQRLSDNRNAVVAPDQKAEVKPSRVFYQTDGGQWQWTQEKAQNETTCG